MRSKYIIKLLLCYYYLFTSIWVYHIQKIMEAYSDRCQGSYIEINEASIIWQFKDCDVELGSMLAEILITESRQIINNYKLSVIKGKDFIKIKPKKASLCAFSILALNELLKQKNLTDRVFYFGNDIDESMKIFFDKIEINSHNIENFMKTNIEKMMIQENNNNNKNNNNNNIEIQDTNDIKEDEETNIDKTKINIIDNLDNKLTKRKSSFDNEVEKALREFNFEVVPVTFNYNKTFSKVNFHSRESLKGLFQKIVSVYKSQNKLFL